MPFQEDRGHCDRCGRDVLVRREVPNHFMHAMLSLFTCVWLPMWLIVAMTGKGPWRCTQCGSTGVRDPVDEIH